MNVTANGPLEPLSVHAAGGAFEEGRNGANLIFERFQRWGRMAWGWARQAPVGPPAMQS